MNNISALSDNNLFEACKKWGKKALQARRKFAGLLPEVYKRGLYEKKGFSSIFEFAAKLAGFNKEQVQRVLQLERKFEDKPVLKQALVNGDVSFNKLARVASVATVENQAALLEKTKLLPCSALNVFVKDMRNRLQNEEASDGFEFGLFRKEIKLNGLGKPSTDANSVSGHRINHDLELISTLSDEVKFKLMELKKKGLDINEILLELLQKREEEIAEEKEYLAEKEQPKKPSKYINVRIKKVLKKEYGTRCSIPGCNKPFRAIHHTQRFGLTETHDPRFLAPLCDEHHKIAHCMDVKYSKYLHSYSR